MGADLIATALPLLDAERYEEVISRAKDHAAATAAVLAGYDGDGAFPPEIAETINEHDDAAIELILGHPGGLDAVRDAARRGATYITQRPHGGSWIYPADELGGPDLLIVGGSTHGDDPFPEFRSVALLAALLTNAPPATPDSPTAD